MRWWNSIFGGYPIVFYCWLWKIDYPSGKSCLFNMSQHTTDRSQKYFTEIKVNFSFYHKSYTSQFCLYVISYLLHIYMYTYKFWRVWRTTKMDFSMENQEITFVTVLEYRWGTPSFLKPSWEHLNNYFWTSHIETVFRMGGGYLNSRIGDKEEFRLTFTRKC